MLGDKELDNIARRGDVELFKIGGKPYRVKLLSVNASDEWLDMAERVDRLEQEATQANASGSRDVSEKRRAFVSALRDAVFDYNPPENFDGDPGEIPMAQLIDAYQTLKAVSDPFVHSGRRQMAMMAKQMEIIPKEALAKVLGSSNV